MLLEFDELLEFELDELLEDELDELFDDEFEFEFEELLDDEFELEFELELEELLPATTIPSPLRVLVAPGRSVWSSIVEGAVPASAAAPARTVIPAAKAVESFHCGCMCLALLFLGLPPVRKTSHGNEYSGGPLIVGYSKSWSGQAPFGPRRCS